MNKPSETHEEHDDGVASSLTGAVGKALEKPFSALLTPAMEVFGEVLRSRAAETAAKWQNKRRGNILKQKATVERSGVVFPELPSEVQAILSLEWSEAAQHVDPDVDSELASLWEAVLSKIARQEDDARNLISILKKLEPADAAFLLNTELPFFDDRSSADSPSIGRLSSAGLIHRKKIPPYLYVGFAVMSGGIWLLSRSAYFERFGLGGSGMNFEFILFAMGGMFFTLGIAMPLLVSLDEPRGRNHLRRSTIRSWLTHLGQDKFELTSLGMQLRTQGLKFQKLRRERPADKAW